MYSNNGDSSNIFETIDDMVTHLLGNLPLASWPRKLVVYRHDITRCKDIDVPTIIKSDFQDWIDDDPEVLEKIEELEDQR